MSRTSVLPWILLSVWAVWIFGLQAAWMASDSAPAWVPDMGLVLALGLAVRLPTQDLPLVGLCVGLARASVSVDPPAAVLVAYLGAVAVVRALRSVIEVKSPPAILLVAFPLSLGISRWLAWVHAERAAAALGVALTPADLSMRAGGDWRGALATGIAAALFAAALSRLPGLSPLHRRRAWRVGASSR